MKYPKTITLALFLGAVSYSSQQGMPGATQQAGQPMPGQATTSEPNAMELMVKQLAVIDCDNPMMAAEMKKAPKIDTSAILPMLKASPEWDKLPKCVQEHLQMAPAEGAANPVDQGQMTANLDAMVNAWQQIDCNDPIQKMGLESTPVAKEIAMILPMVKGTDKWDQIPECVQEYLLKPPSDKSMADIQQQGPSIEQIILTLQTLECDSEMGQKLLNEPMDQTGEEVLLMTADMLGSRWNAIRPCFQKRLRDLYQYKANQLADQIATMKCTDREIQREIEDDKLDRKWYSLFEQSIGKEKFNKLPDCVQDRLIREQQNHGNGPSDATMPANMPTNTMQPMNQTNWDPNGNSQNWDNKDMNMTNWNQTGMNYTDMNMNMSDWNGTEMGMNNWNNTDMEWNPEGGNDDNAMPKEIKDAMYEIADVLSENEVPPMGNDWEDLARDIEDGWKDAAEAFNEAVDSGEFEENDGRSSKGASLTAAFVATALAFTAAQF